MEPESLGEVAAVGSLDGPSDPVGYGDGGECEGGRYRGAGVSLL